jgi:outer membrane immunogenic protein
VGAIVSRLSRSVLIVVAALMAAPAAGADLSYPSPYVAATPYGVYNWTGAYAGLNAAYQWGSVANLSLHPSGFSGGAQAGYNWQTGQFVVGAETDIQLSAADDTFAPYQFSNPWFGTFRGRAGMAFSNVLLYATAGLAYGEGKLSAFGGTETHTNLGWTAGAGIEVGFTPHWSAKAEYLYFDLGNQSYVLTGVNNGLTFGLVRLGVNYHF